MPQTNCLLNTVLFSIEGARGNFWKKRMRGKSINAELACAADKAKPLLVVRLRASPCSFPLLCTRIWVRAMIGLLKEPLFHWPIRLKGNSKRTSGNSLSHLGAQYKDLGAADVVSAQTFRRLHDAFFFLERRMLGPFPPRSWEKNDRRSLKNVCFWGHCWRHQPG